MRGDNGTENGIAARMQEFLSGNNTFLYGKSTGNQRIEMFWDFLRKECVQYWIDSLGTLRDTGLFTGDFRGRPFDSEGGGGAPGTFGRDRLFIFITGSAGKFISG